MKTGRVAVILLTLVQLVSFPSTAFAHPLNNFTINHYAGLTVRRESVTIEYVLDMAEIPTLQEIATFDADGNSQPDPAEAAPYREAQCRKLSEQTALTANGQPLALAVSASAIEFPAGAAGLLTLRLTCGFSAALTTSTESVSLELALNAYSDRLGWREIVVQAEGVALQGDFATTSVSGKLRTYPQELLSTPLDQRTLAFSLLPAGAQSATAAPTTEPRANAVIGGISEADFMRYITLREVTPWTVAVALLVALAWGAAHAMTPGHGKTIVGAYLVGARGTARHAMYLGLATTITHTAGVFALGLITLFASQYILPETLFPWLGLFSGLLVIGLGINMFVERMRGFLGRGHGHRRGGSEAARATRSHEHSHGGDDHHHGGGGHPHGGEAAHAHTNGHGHNHVHAPVMALAGAPEHDHTHGVGGHSHGGDVALDHPHDDHAYGEAGTATGAAANTPTRCPAWMGSR